MFEPMSNRSNEDNKPPKADDKSKSKGKKLYRTTSTFTPANPAYPIFGTSVLSTVYAKNLKAFAEQAGGDATKCSRETAQSIMKLEKVTMAAPADLPPRATNTERMMQEMKIKRLVDREFTLDDNLAKCLNILLGNCDGERITKGGKENKATSLMMAAAYDSDDDEDLYKASMCF